MIATYDLRLSPVTFDFVHWLVNAERRRLAAGDEGIWVKLRIGERQESVRDMEFSPERKAWRVQNLLIPLCWTLPSVRGVSLGEEGEQEFGYGPEGWALKPLRPTRAAAELVGSWVRTNSPVVTITVRQSDFQVTRNSNKEELIKLGEWFRNRHAKVVFVPDTEALLYGQDVSCGDFPLCHQAALSPDQRLALYDRALLNIFTSGGPYAVALYGDCGMISCKHLVPGIATCSEEVQRRLGLTPETDLGPYQRISWAGDSMAELQPLVEEILPKVLGRERLMPKLHTFPVKMEQRKLNIASALERGLPKLEYISAPHDRPAHLMCFGPSLADTWRDALKMGGEIFTNSGALKFLLERGVVPSAHIETDPRPHKAMFTAEADPRVEYLISSACDPQVFNQLSACRVRLWHSWEGEELENFILGLDPDAWLALGGSNVGLRSIAVLSAMGYRKIHIYGMDGSLKEGKRHAGAHNGKEQRTFVAKPVGSDRSFVTTPQLASGAREFLVMASDLVSQGFEFFVYGDGMLTEMLKVAVQRNQKESANAA